MRLKDFASTIQTMVLRSCLVLITIPSASFAAENEACVEFARVRTLITEQKYSEAKAQLHCRLAQNPNDVDSKTLLADLFWWTGETVRGREQARKVLALSRDPDTRIRMLSRVNRTRLSASIEAVGAENDHGLEKAVLVRTRYYNKNELQFGFRENVRVYESETSVLIREQAFMLGHVWAATDRLNLSLNGVFVDKAQILPRFSTELSAEYSGKNDHSYFFGVRGGFYDDTTTILVTPGMRYQLSDEWSLRPRVYAVVAPDVFVSGAMHVAYRLNNFTNVALGFIGGKTFEGVGLEDEFHAFDLLSSRLVLPQLNLQLGAQRREGKIRSESRFNIGFEWMF